MYSKIERETIIIRNAQAKTWDVESYIGRDITRIRRMVEAFPGCEVVVDSDEHIRVRNVPTAALTFRASSQTGRKRDA